MSLISYYRTKCKKCGNKFTIKSENFCAKCKSLGIQCMHKEFCFACYKDTVTPQIYYGALTAISLVMFYTLGVKIL